MELSRDEFETLPPTLKRKCFSTSERLRYTQAYANPHPTHQRYTVGAAPPAHIPRNQSYFSRDFLRNPKQSLSRAKPAPGQHDNFLSRPLSRRGRNAAVQTSLTSKDISQEDALFFSRLPDKLQRRQFSAAEQSLLAGQQERVILDAADEKLYRLHRRAANRSLPSLSSSYSGCSETRSLTTDDLETLQTESDDMDEELMNTFRWIDESEPDLSLDAYHDHLTNAAKDHLSPEAVVSASNATRRNRSFTNFSLKNLPRPSTERRNTSEVQRQSRPSLDLRTQRSLQGVVPAVPTVPSLAQLKAQEALSPTERRPSATPAPIKLESWGSGWGPQSHGTGRGNGRKDSVGSLNPSAEHYLNPEARLKLRLYLATPSKFDEALEFGFPSLPRPSIDTTPARVSLSSRRRSSEAGRGIKKDGAQQPLTFLRDDTTPDLQRFAHDKDYGRPRVTTIQRPQSSLYSPDESAPSSLTAPSSPGLTESTDSRDFEKERDRDYSSDRGHSDDRGHGDRGHASRDLPREHYGQGLAAREMTLRMTLTRPDLRADDGQLYPHAAPHVAAPQPKFVGLGRSRPSTAKGAGPVGGFVAGAGLRVGAVAVAQVPAASAKDPLSLERLFDDEPAAVKQARGGGFRKLFSKRW